MIARCGPHARYRQPLLALLAVFELPQPPLRKTLFPMGYSVLQHRLSTRAGEMNVTTLRLSSPSVGAPWRRTLLAALAATAVVIGLLAMHSLFANPGNVQLVVPPTTTSATVTVLTDLNQAAAGGGDSALFQSCTGGLCEVECLIIGALCTLALIVAAVVWLKHRRSIQPFASTRLRHTLRIVAQHISELEPPSLLVLSISRT